MPARTHREAQDAARRRAPGAPRPSADGSHEWLRALQRSAGNAAVARLVQNVARQEHGPRQLTLPPLQGPGMPDPAASLPSFQLTPPSLLQPPAPPGGPPGGWRLLPDLQLRLRPLDDELQPDRIRDLVRQALSPVTLPPPGTLPGPRPAVPPPAGPSLAPPPPAPPGRPPGPFDVEPTEPAELGDLVHALASVPEIDRLSQMVRHKLWTQYETGEEHSTGERWAIAISGIVVGGSALTGALATPSGRQMLAGLGGRPLSIPGIPWFQPEFNVQEPNIILGAHIDVGAFLNGRGGFSTADRGPTPLTPQAP
jgi:hypothetical protein